MQQLSFTSMHNKSRAVTAGSFPFQKITMEKKKCTEKKETKKFVFFSSTKAFQMNLLCACVYILGKKAK